MKESSMFMILSKNKNGSIMMYFVSQSVKDCA